MSYILKAGELGSKVSGLQSIVPRSVCSHYHLRRRIFLDMGNDNIQFPVQLSNSCRPVLSNARLASKVL